MEVLKKVKMGTYSFDCMIPRYGSKWLGEGVSSSQGSDT
jgi:hypothetical protein